MQRKPRAAFFDVDNTLLNLKSMFSFQQFFYEHAPDPWRGGQAAYAAFLDRLQAHPEKHDRLALNRFFYESYRGWRHDDVVALTGQWFEAMREQHGSGLWIAEAIELAAQLREDGFELVAVSGSTIEILAPVLEHLGFDGCLATTLEREAGRYTGRIVPPQVIGDGKAQAIRGYVRERGMALDDCAACGDHITDLSMLELVGHAYVIAGDPALEAIAAERDWPLLGAPSASLEGQLAHV